VAFRRLWSVRTMREFHAQSRSACDALTHFACHARSNACKKKIKDVSQDDLVVRMKTKRPKDKTKCLWCHSCAFAFMSSHVRFVSSFRRFVCLRARDWQPGLLHQRSGGAAACGCWRLRSTILGACQSRILPSVPKPRVTSPHV
jgi:hypothetical protein